MDEPDINSTRARLIAFYLPQFHPIPENDAWWGKGFTEWTNVVKARPLFPGHFQPHLPAQLGFCDLRVPEVRQKQAELARAHGIAGFCYWHYWFEGSRLLERPFNEVLATGQPDFPFCLAWANETWSRRWLGEEKEVLRQQTYSPEDDKNHIRWLIRAFSDPRYVRVGGRPLFLVYRPDHLPAARKTTAVFREECLAAGLAEPYLLAVNSFRDRDYRSEGFDGTLDFQPHLGVVPNVLSDGLKKCDYTAARKTMLERKRAYPLHPCLFVSWDNTPRRGGDGIVFTDSTPASFQDGLQDMVAAVEHKPWEERLVFLNAWNEWAEGNHLEPDQKFGLQYLEAVRRVNCLP
jgi:lipopolysaccharide biosynthesis protein